ncbi:MAG: hypothetical protein AAF409_18560 [Pseudomonadota bacterium]
MSCTRYAIAGALALAQVMTGGAAMAAGSETDLVLAERCLATHKTSRRAGRLEGWNVVRVERLDATAELLVILESVSVRHLSIHREWLRCPLTALEDPAVPSN